MVPARTPPNQAMKRTGFARRLSPTRWAGRNRVGSRRLFNTAGAVEVHAMTYLTVYHALIHPPDASVRDRSRWRLRSAPHSGTFSREIPLTTVGS